MSDEFKSTVRARFVARERVEVVVGGDVLNRDRADCLMSSRTVVKSDFWPAPETGKEKFRSQ